MLLWQCFDVKYQNGNVLLGNDGNDENRDAGNTVSKFSSLCQICTYAEACSLVKYANIRSKSKYFNIYIYIYIYIYKYVYINIYIFFENMGKAAIKKE